MRACAVQRSSQRAVSGMWFQSNDGDGQVSTTPSAARLFERRSHAVPTPLWEKYPMTIRGRCTERNCKNGRRSCHADCETIHADRPRAV